MGVHAAGTPAGWGQGLPGGPQLPPHHATTVTAPPGVQAAPPPPPPTAQMMAYPMQQFQVNDRPFRVYYYSIKRNLNKERMSLKNDCIRYTNTLFQFIFIRSYWLMIN